MLPLVGVPMIQCVFEWLARHDVTDTVLSLGYLPEQFTEAYPTNEIAGVRVDYAVEPEPSTPPAPSDSLQRSSASTRHSWS